MEKMKKRKKKKAMVQEQIAESEIENEVTGQEWKTSGLSGEQKEKRRDQVDLDDMDQCLKQSERNRRRWNLDDKAYTGKFA